MPTPRHRWWRHLRAAPAGERFVTYYQSRAADRRRGESRWKRPLRLVSALVCIGIAIPLMVMPGPAVLFYAIAGLLVAGESILIARLLDRTELFARRLAHRFRRRRRK